jgi:DNA-binding NarL/FixJ family response regulator
MESIMGWSQTHYAPLQSGASSAQVRQSAERSAENDDISTAFAMPAALRTVFVMDDELLRHGLMHIAAELGAVHFVGDLQRGPGLVDRLRTLAPELLVVGAEAGPELPALLAELNPAPKVLAVVDGDDPREHALPLIRAGADGLVDRRSPSADLRAAILRVIDGHSALDARSADSLIDELRAQVEPGYSRMLTRREGEVLGLLTNGLDNRAIAGTLFISEATVKFHLHNIMDKFGVHSRAALVATVLRGHHHV